MLVGYARVSTSEQTLALQRDALTKAGCTKIYTDTASGAQTDRPGLLALPGQISRKAQENQLPASLRCAYASH